MKKKILGKLAAAIIAATVMCSMTGCDFFDDSSMEHVFESDK